jgi:2-polyprenyl-3-methyl-5-hydroxy-6-metoxy-1,4-benzoquinol methylase
MSSYVFDNTRAPSSERLSYLERVCDPATIARFEKLGVAPGWTCLEIGAGGGSIAYWLSERVGPDGAVVVTDVEPRFLDDLAKHGRNVEVLRHNIIRDALPSGAFDLIHARHVLVHLPKAVATLEKLKTALKPGGWLVIEDFDPIIDRTVLFADRLKAHALDRAVGAMWKIFAKHGGAGVGWASLLPAHFRQLGMCEINAEAIFHCATGSSDYAQFHKSSLIQTRTEGVAHGFASEQDYETAIELLNDPITMYYSNPAFTAWCRRPF